MRCSLLEDYCSDGRLLYLTIYCTLCQEKLNIQKIKIMASGPITSWEIDEEKVETVQTLFFGAPKSLQVVIAVMKLKDAYSLEGKL